MPSGVLEDTTTEPFQESLLRRLPQASCVREAWAAISPLMFTGAVNFESGSACLTLSRMWAQKHAGDSAPCRMHLVCFTIVSVLMLSLIHI